MAKIIKPIPMDSQAFIHGATIMQPQVAVGARAAEFVPQLVPSTTAPAPAPAPAPEPTAPVRLKKNEVEPSNKEKTVTSSKKDVMPWDGIDTGIWKFVQVRMSLVLREKIKYITENTIGRRSMHDVMVDAIEKAVEAELATIAKKGRGG